MRGRHCGGVLVVAVVLVVIVVVSVVVVVVIMVVIDLTLAAVGIQRNGALLVRGL
jgi:hypothetical protein